MHKFSKIRGSICIVFTESTNICNIFPRLGVMLKCKGYLYFEQGGNESATEKFISDGKEISESINDTNRISFS